MTNYKCAKCGVKLFDNGGTPVWCADCQITVKGEPNYCRGCGREVINDNLAVRRQIEGSLYDAMWCVKCKGGE